MDVVVCPVDQAPVEVVQHRWGPDGLPLVRCGACDRRFVLDRQGVLQELPA